VDPSPSPSLPSPQPEGAPPALPLPDTPGRPNRRWRREKLIAFAISLLSCAVVALLVIAIFDPALPEHLGQAFAHPQLPLLLRAGALLLVIACFLLLAGCLASQLIDEHHTWPQRICAALFFLFSVPCVAVLFIGVGDPTLTNHSILVLLFFATACVVLGLTFFTWSLWLPRLTASVSSNQRVWQIRAGRAVGAALLITPLIPALAAIAVLTRTAASPDINRSTPVFYLDYLGLGLVLLALAIAGLRRRAENAALRRSAATEPREEPAERAAPSEPVPPTTLQQRLVRRFGAGDPVRAVLQLVLVLSLLVIAAPVSVVALAYERVSGHQPPAALPLVLTLISVAIVSACLNALWSIRRLQPWWNRLFPAITCVSGALWALSIFLSLPPTTPLRRALYALTNLFLLVTIVAAALSLVVGVVAKRRRLRQENVEASH
jgi:hypothetical protein